MKFTFTDDTNFDELTFKKLLLTCNELIFADTERMIDISDGARTDGGKTYQIQHLISQTKGSTVNFSIQEISTNDLDDTIFRKYFQQDLSNNSFLLAVFDAIERKQIKSIYLEGHGCFEESGIDDFREWLLINKEKLLDYDIESVPTPEDFINIRNIHGALYQYKILLADISLRLTTALLSCNNTTALPLSISPFYNTLVSSRMSSEKYVPPGNVSKQLGIKMIDCVLSSDALNKIDIDEILAFREKTRAYYKAWEIEVKKLEAIYFKDVSNISDHDLYNIFDADINPRLFELKSAIKKISEERFKNILKTVKNTVLSGITFSSLSSLSIPAAIAGFIGCNIKTPQLTDEIIDSYYNLKNIRKSNGLTYMLEINEKLNSSMMD